ncbi:MAG: TfoX/Sxy family protein [Gemmatimonadetes bacterium]|nr:TfoX/Sxy family protein [Gemmatimonadota bacterium]
MSLDAELADGIRSRLAGLPDVEEKRMFGGIAFMVGGHMCCGVLGERLMLRLGDAGAARALEEPHTAPMDFTGRVMRSMAFVEPEGWREPGELAAWVDRALDFVGTLPPK